MTIQQIITTTLIGLGTLPSLVCASMMKDPLPMDQNESSVKIYEFDEPGDPLPHCIPPIYPQFAGVELCGGMNVFAAAEFLWWEFVNVTPEIAQINKNDPSNKKLQVMMDSPYRPGFKVSPGAEFPHFDQWVAQLAYTYYHPKFTNNISTSGTETKVVPRVKTKKFPSLSL